MKYLILITCLFPSLSWSKEKCGPFYGSVHSTDLNDKLEKITRNNVFLFREWSSEVQFDKILLKKSDLIGDVTGLIVTLMLDRSERAPLKSPVTVWDSNSDYYVVEGIDVREMLTEKKSLAQKFVISIEKNQKVICSRVFPIRRDN